MMTAHDDDQTYFPPFVFSSLRHPLAWLKKKPETQVHFIVQYEKIICVLHGLHK